MHARNLAVSATLIIATSGLWMICSLTFTAVIKPGDSFGGFAGISLPLLVTFLPFLIGALATATIGIANFRPAHKLAYTFTTISIIALLFAFCSGTFIPSNWTSRILITEIVLTFFIAAAPSALAGYQIATKTR